MGSLLLSNGLDCRRLYTKFLVSCEPSGWTRHNPTYGHNVLQGFWHGAPDSVYRGNRRRDRNLSDLTVFSSLHWESTGSIS